jgi:hypothetical protein
MFVYFGYWGETTSSHLSMVTQFHFTTTVGAFNTTDSTELISFYWSNNKAFSKEAAVQLHKQSS